MLSTPVYVAISEMIIRMRINISAMSSSVAVLLSGFRWILSIFAKRWSCL